MRRLTAEELVAQFKETAVALRPGRYAGNTDKYAVQNFMDEVPFCSRDSDDKPCTRVIPQDLLLRSICKVAASVDLAEAGRVTIGQLLMTKQRQRRQALGRDTTEGWELVKTRVMGKLGLSAMNGRGSIMEVLFPATATFEASLDKLLAADSTLSEEEQLYLAYLWSSSSSSGQQQEL